MEETRGPLRVCEVDDPEPAPDGVVVQVHATGLCRSDWHTWVGHEVITLPHVLGHELAGSVVAVGSDVRRWRRGDRVTVPFVEGCGRCQWCAGGDAQVCPDQHQPGVTHWGSFAERVALREADTNLVALPADVSFEAAASLGCRFATAWRALTGRAALRPAETVTVVGLGGVGLSAVMIAKALGALVIAVDLHPDALQAAARLGADHLIDPRAHDVPALVHELTSGGSHVSLDAVGSEQTCSDALLSLRRRGRHVQVGLLPSVEGDPRLPMSRVIGWELDVLGTHGMAAHDYPDMLTLIANGALRPQDLVGRVVSLEEAASLLPRMTSAASAGMTLVDPTRH